MKEHFRKTQKEMKLSDFIRHSLTAGVHDIRETIKELKDMEAKLNDLCGQREAIKRPNLPGIV